MKVREKFTSENLFDEINKIYPFPFVKSFPVDKLNRLYIITHGERTLSQAGITLTVPEIAAIIVGCYSDKWDRVHKVLASDISFVESHIEVVTETTNENGNTSNNATETTVDKVSAYNDENFANGEQSTNTNESHGTNANTVEKTRERKVTENVTKNLENAINYLQRALIYNIIFADVNRVITLSIYE